MKVINSKLAAIGLAAFVFASCSDSNSDPTGPTPNVDLQRLSLQILQAALLQNSKLALSNYKNTTANARKSSSQEQLRQEHLLLLTKLLSQLFLRMQRQWSDPEDMTAGKTISCYQQENTRHGAVTMSQVLPSSLRVVLSPFSTSSTCRLYHFNVDGGAQH